MIVSSLLLLPAYLAQAFCSHAHLQEHTAAPLPVLVRPGQRGAHRCLRLRPVSYNPVSVARSRR